MLVLSEDGGWVVPPQRRLDPAGVTHQVRMLGSARAAPTSSRARRADARACEVVEVSPLLRQLLLAAVDMPAQYDREGRDGALARLLLHEVDRAPALPLHIPLPRDAAGALCQAFMAARGHPLAAAGLGGRLHESRSFSRHSASTGMSYAQWRQRACVVLALALAAGDPVTVIALDFGYQGPAAFSTMFRRVLGAALRLPAHRLGPP